MATPHGSAPTLEALYLEQAKLARAMLAPMTRAGYANDWSAFSRFCAAHRLTPLPATTETVSLFVCSKLAEQRKASSVRRLVAGIAHHHREEGYAVEWISRVEDLLAGARRLQPQTLKQAAPLGIEDIRAISRRLRQLGTTKALRDRALIVAGFASALRSSSLVALDLEDVTFTRQGAVLAVRREKNDQLGKGRHIGLPFGKHADTCPVRTLRAWIRRRGLDDGPLFCHVAHDKARMRRLGAERISILVRQAMKVAGRECSGISGHSLRSGLITAAAECDCQPLKIAAHTGHKTIAMVQRYFRRSDVFRHNVLTAIDM